MPEGHRRLRTAIVVSLTLVLVQATVAGATVEQTLREYFDSNGMKIISQEQFDLFLENSMETETSFTFLGKDVSYEAFKDAVSKMNPTKRMYYIYGDDFPGYYSIINGKENDDYYWQLNINVNSHEAEFMMGFFGVDEEPKYAKYNTPKYLVKPSFVLKNLSLANGERPFDKLKEFAENAFGMLPLKVNTGSPSPPPFLGMMCITGLLETKSEITFEPENGGNPRLVVTKRDPESLDIKVTEELPEKK